MAGQIADRLGAGRADARLRQSKGKGGRLVERPRTGLAGLVGRQAETGVGGDDAVVVLDAVFEDERAAQRRRGLVEDEDRGIGIRGDGERPVAQLVTVADDRDAGVGAEQDAVFGKRGSGLSGDRGRWRRGGFRGDGPGPAVGRERDLERHVGGGANDDEAAFGRGDRRRAGLARAEQQRRATGIGLRVEPGVDPRLGVRRAGRKAKGVGDERPVGSIGPDRRDDQHEKEEGAQRIGIGPVGARRGQAGAEPAETAGEAPAMGAPERDRAAVGIVGEVVLEGRERPADEAVDGFEAGQRLMPDRPAQPEEGPERDERGDGEAGDEGEAQQVGERGPDTEPGQDEETAENRDERRRGAPQALPGECEGGEEKRSLERGERASAAASRPLLAGVRRFHAVADLHFGRRQPQPDPCRRYLARNCGETRTGARPPGAYTRMSMRVPRPSVGRPVGALPAVVPATASLASMGRGSPLPPAIGSFTGAGFLAASRASRENSRPVA